MPRSRCKANRLLEMMGTVTRDHLLSPRSLRSLEHMNRIQNSSGMCIVQHDSLKPKLMFKVHSTVTMQTFKMASSSEFPNNVPSDQFLTRHTPLAQGLLVA
jgi:hypothetical protein